MFLYYRKDEILHSRGALSHWMRSNGYLLLRLLYDWYWNGLLDWSHGEGLLHNRRYNGLVEGLYDWLDRGSRDG